MSRRDGRVIAFQALYSWDVSKVSLEDLLDFSWLQKDSEIKSGKQEELSQIAKDDRTFASLLIAGTIEHIDEIDQMIKDNLSSNWSMERINRVSLAILRISLYEIKFQSDSQMRIVIDEAVNMAKIYGPDDSYKFVNAILDNIAKK